MKQFDKSFGDSYREHVFLQHDKVPDVVKLSVTDVMLIESNKVKNKRKHESFSSVKRTFKPEDPEHGANLAELLRWLKPVEDFKVLRFHSMYDAFKGAPSGEQDKDFEERLSTGLKKADYRQY